MNNPPQPSRWHTETNNRIAYPQFIIFILTIKPKFDMLRKFFSFAGAALLPVLPHFPGRNNQIFFQEDVPNYNELTQTMKMRFNLLLIVLILIFIQPPGFSKNGYIRDWLIIGSFKAQPDENNLAHEYIPDEAKIHAFGGQRHADRLWMLYHANNDVLNFADPLLKFQFREQSVAYAQVFVYSPQSQTAQLRVGSDDGVAIWCNSKRIHFVNHQRTHNFDDDQIAFELQQGWNRLLFKVINGALDWKLSARILAENEVHLQAENPLTIPVNLNTPADLKLWEYNPELTPIIEENNEPYVHFDFYLLNQSTKVIKNVDLAICLHRKPLISLQPVSDILGGELFLCYARIPFAAMSDSLLKNAAAIELLCKHSDAYKYSPFPLFNLSKIIATVFNHWHLTNWSAFSEDNTLIFKKEWQPPLEFTGLELDLHLEVEKYCGTFYLNRKEKTDQFTGYSGAIRLTNEANPRQKYQLKLELQSKDSTLIAAEPLPFQATVKPHFTGIESFLFDRKLATDLFRQPVSIALEVELAIFQALKQQNLRELRKLLADVRTQFKPVSTKADSYTIAMIGNAHIDMAWLWRYPESINVCRETFRNAVENMKKYPDYKFSHGQALSYWWIEEQDPELFKEIKNFVKNEQWEIVGGTWVEPDLNLSDGESQIRQYLYGKHYFKEKFDIDINVGWMPDTFGHPATLPQILHKCGIKTYSFFRPWNSERFFHWRSPDGSQVLAHRPRNWFVLNDVDQDVFQGLWEEVKNFGVHEVARFYGHGDHGGGPNRKHIEKIQELDDLLAFPQVKMTRMDQYYQNIFNLLNDSTRIPPEFPVVEADQNFVFPGCYTSQAKTKWNNRRAENLVPLTEVFASLATFFKFDYPQREFTGIWRDLLFNQFHDILAGSSIGPVYEDADQIYQNLFERTQQILQGALQVLASNVNTLFSDNDALPLVVFNSLNWPRTAPVEMTIHLQPEMNDVQLFDTEGQPTPLQIIEQQEDKLKVVFLAREIPEIGYRTFWLKQLKQKVTVKPLDQSLKLENQFLSVEINRRTGCIDKFRMKDLDLNLFNGPGCEFQLQADEPDNMSAWEIGLKGPILPFNKPSRVEVVEDGAVRKVIRVEYKFNQSLFIQKYILYNELPQLDVQVTINWLERQKMLKIAFPIQIENATATCDIPFGAITRERNGQEIPAQKWIDLSNNEYGVSLLNDCKYGFDIKGTVMRMSALRAPTDPDSTADRGYHGFSYALFPHKGTWSAAKTNLAAYSFNVPPAYIFTQIHRGGLPPSSSFLVIDPDNVVLSAFKKAEDNNDMILRVYEAYGEATSLKITLLKTAHTIYESDMIEWSQEKLAQRGYEIELPISPYEIKTLRIAF